MTTLRSLLFLLGSIPITTVFGILVPLGVLLLLGALVIRRIIRGGTPPGVPQS